MTAKWWAGKVCGALVIMAAAVMAGPMQVGGGGATGADPQLPDCNATSENDVNCPLGDNDVKCGTTYKYYNSADPGGVNNKRFDKSSTAKCRSLLKGCPTDTVDYVEGLGCTPKKVSTEPPGGGS